MSKFSKGTKPEDTKGAGVSEDAGDTFGQSHPTVSDVDVDSDSMTATREIEFADGSELETEAPVKIEAEDATLTATPGDGEVTKEDGTEVSEANQAQVGVQASGVDKDGKVGGYDQSAVSAVLRPADAAPYVSSADEQRDQAFHADLAERSGREERQRRAAEDFEKASRA